MRKEYNFFVRINCMVNNMDEVTIYTDGACSGNPGPGGWGAILMLGENRKEISGGSENTTNNIMELTAVIEALKILNDLAKSIFIVTVHM